MIVFYYSIKCIISYYIINKPGIPWNAWPRAHQLSVVAAQTSGLGRPVANVHRNRPMLIEAVLPNRRGAIEIASVILPILAFILRFVAGTHHIARNRCTQRTRKIQLVCFGLGIFLLVFLDAVLILSYVMPPGALVANGTDIAVFFGFGVAYVLAMGLAMYPGRNPAPGNSFTSL